MQDIKKILCETTDGMTFDVSHLTEEEILKLVRAAKEKLISVGNRQIENEVKATENIPSLYCKYDHG